MWDESDFSSWTNSSFDWSYRSAAFFNFNTIRTGNTRLPETIADFTLYGDADWGTDGEEETWKACLPFYTIWSQVFGFTDRSFASSHGPIHAHAWHLGHWDKEEAKIEALFTKCCRGAMVSELRKLQLNMTNRSLQVFLTLHSADTSPEYDGPMFAWSPVRADRDDRGQTKRGFPMPSHLWCRFAGSSQAWHAW